MSRNFHAYIIESPSAPDLYHKRFEGEALCKTLAISGVTATHRLAVNRTAFEAAFSLGLAEHFKETNASPIIHISAHGSDAGIQLTSGEVVAWDELSDILRNLNRLVSAGNGFLLCMSTCQGAAGCQMAMKEDDLPFLAIVGNVSTPTWSETNIGFATFYHLFAGGRELDECVKGMKAASGNDGFTFIWSADARIAFLEAVSKQSILKFEDQVEEGTSSDQEKATGLSKESSR